MLFSSPTFLFYFLPLTLLLAWITRRNRVVLLICSLIFYAWGEPTYVFLLVFVIIFNYYVGEAIQKYVELSKLLFLIGVITDITILAIFKYADFLIENLNDVLREFAFEALPIPNIPLPLGISFFTFQAVAYLIDIYMGRISPSHSLLRFAVFKSFFPQLIAGPIVRYQWVAADLERDHFNEMILAYGVGRFVIGLAKKVIIADNIGPLVNQIFALQPYHLSFASAWVGAIGFTLQIYFDFSGYSDMAIGMGRMFGIRLPENFRHPYISMSIQEFWRRWHITLSTWFRDYLYFPLGGSREGQVRTYFNLCLVFFLCGLWHGATWSFVVWGLYHGAFLIAERTFFGRVLRALPRPLRHAYALAVVVFGWVIFRSPNLPYAIAMMKAMIGINGSESSQVLWPISIDQFNMLTVLTIGIGILASLPWGVVRTRGARSWLPTIPQGNAILAAAYPLGIFTLLVISFGFVATQTHLAFIYFRF